MVDRKGDWSAPPQAECVDILDSRDVLGERMEKLSLSFLANGTTVREVASDENMVDALVADEADDFMLAASNERLGPLEESAVDTES